LSANAVDAQSLEPSSPHYNTIAAGHGGDDWNSSFRCANPVLSVPSSSGALTGSFPGHPNLNLTAEERRVYGQLLKEADPDGFGAVSGDVAVKFFERTKLPPDVLGQVSHSLDLPGANAHCLQIWQIADTENRGFLTPAGFGVVLRLIGHAQNGRAPSVQVATQSMGHWDGIDADG
jgi:epidermal growth factor receptor substrate 15